jgi:hypothetical protein
MGRRPIGEDTMTAPERRRRRKPGGRKLDITEAHIAAVEARIKELKCPSDTIEKSSPPPRDPFAFPLGNRNLVVAYLIRKADSRPLKATWRSKREASIIGADVDGNFFLRHCDGSVRYWEHKAQADTTIAPSVREFLCKLVEARL